MRKHTILAAATLAALLGWSAGPALAQHGGEHHGGEHQAAPHGAPHGGAPANWNGGAPAHWNGAGHWTGVGNWDGGRYWGGNRGWYGRGWYGYGYPYRGWGGGWRWGLGYGLGYPWYYGGYYSPYYYGYPYNYGNYYNDYPGVDYYASAPIVNDYNSYYPPDAGFSGGADTTASTSATINVRVAPGAELWFDGQLTRQQGEVREFVTPSLDPDGTYVYRVRARFSETGRDVERDVRVHAGDRITVDLSRPDEGATYPAPADGAVPPPPADTAPRSRAPVP
jgi:uncharacterized protein (TIGR03000 family)